MNVLAIREILYDIMTAQEDVDPDDPAISLKQQMGVQLSSAVLKEKGVLNIQLQNVVSKKVIAKVAQGLRLLDQPMLPEPQASDLDRLLGQSLEAEIDLKTFLTNMEKMYIRMAVDILGRHKAMQTLGIRGPRIEDALSRE